MSMNKFMVNAAKVGALYIGAWAFWKLGIWYGEGAGVTVCCAIEQGKIKDIKSACDYMNYVQGTEKNLFGTVFTKGGMDWLELVSKNNK